MEIIINNNPIDITLDTEKTLGEVLSGLELWISSTGNRIQGINIDGKDIPSEDLNTVFENDIKNIKKLNISINLWRDLALEALEVLHNVCLAWENSSFEERKDLISIWEDSAAARFLVSDMADVYELCDRSFKGTENITVSSLKVFIEERLREFTDPLREIINAEALVKNISQRMEDLPLDMQTGKELRAAETMQLFSGIGEKLFRILLIYRSMGLSLEEHTIDNQNAKSFIDSFTGILAELQSAYESQDTVLAGDIAEYELSPRLLLFYDALKNFSNLMDPVISKE